MVGRIEARLDRRHTTFKRRGQVVRSNHGARKVFFHALSIGIIRIRVVAWHEMRQYDLFDMSFGRQLAKSSGTEWSSAMWRIRS